MTSLCPDGQAKPTIFELELILGRFHFFVWTVVGHYAIFDGIAHQANFVKTSILRRAHVCGKQFSTSRLSLSYTASASSSQTYHLKMVF